MQRVITTLVALVLSIAILSDAFARPARWCGWYARTQLVSHDPGKDFNNACAWNRWGRRTYTPAPGVIVVWCGRGHRHVGKIVGPCDANGNCLIRSGNDGHAVRTRMRSISGASLRV